MKKITWIFVIMLFSFCFSQPVLANESDSPDKQKKETKKKEVGPWHNFNIDLGLNFTTLNSSVRFGIEDLGVGLDVNLEDALGLDSSTLVLFGKGYYRMGSSRRHRLDFGYTSYRRDATKVLTKEIPIFDIKFPAGSTITSEYNFDIITIGYSYSALKDDRMDIGVGGGFFVMPIEFTIGGSGLSTKSESITAPLPVLNVRADFALTRRLFFKTNAQFFYIKIDDFKASIVAGSVAFEYDVWKNVGFGIGYNHFRTLIEAEDDSYPGASFVGNIEFAYSGLNLYLKVYFF